MDTHYDVMADHIDEEWLAEIDPFCEPASWAVVLIDDETGEPVEGDDVAADGTEGHTYHFVNGYLCGLSDEHLIRSRLSICFSPIEAPKTRKVRLSEVWPALASQIGIVLQDAGIMSINPGDLGEMALMQFALLLLTRGRDWEMSE